MTHDELLAKIDEWFGQTSGVGSMTHHEFCVRSDCDCALIDDRHALLHNALRAVVELHKPDSEGYQCQHCSSMQGCGCCADTSCSYPCPTIQAIEKALS